MTDVSNNVPYCITDDGIMVVIRNQPKLVSATNVNYQMLKLALMRDVHDVEQIEDLVDVRKFIAKKSFGAVEVSDTEVRWYGKKINNFTTDRLLEMLRGNYDLTPIGNFLGKVMENPSEVAQNELYLWLESGHQPLTPDGNVLAFKRVRPDYTDIHSGTFNNSVGAVIPRMKREDVDPDRYNTCSYGYHFCSFGYLPYFSSYSGQNDHIIIVEVNPADIVAIPADYSNQKGRATFYRIVGEVSLEDARTVFDNTPVVRVRYDDEDCLVEDDSDKPYMYDNDYEVLDSENHFREDEPSTDTVTTMMFHHKPTGATYFSDKLMASVKNFGLMETSRQINVPKSTLQGWLVKAGY